MQRKRIARAAARQAVRSRDAVSIVRSSLQGTDLLVIGGDERASQLERLCAAFHLRKARWAQTRETDPTSTSFRHLIDDPDVALVVLLDGLVRHQHARDVVALCKRHGKWLIRLWRSPSPTAIAHAVLMESAERSRLTSDVR